MNRRALFVDDDPHLLAAFKRELRKKVELTTAEGAEAGIEAVARQGPFAVVVSDYKMPGMNGVDMLHAIRQVSPETVRVLLTGHAEMKIAMQAVNEGHIFRLLTKPCAPETLERVLEDAFRHYELLKIEKELLERTLKGSVAVLCDLVSLVKPNVFGRISRILPYIRELSHRLADPRPWETETAAMLSVLGFITLPDALIAKVEKGRPLTEAEMRQFLGHPAFGAKLVARIPRMESVAEIMAYQEKQYDGGGAPKDDYRGAVIPLGARILKAVVDFDILLANGMPKAGAITRLHHRKGVYDPSIVAALAEFAKEQSRYALQKVHLHALEPGMILAEDLVGTRGGESLLLMAKGREFSETIIEYLLDSSRSIHIRQPVAVVAGMTKVEA